MEDSLSSPGDSFYGEHDGVFFQIKINLVENNFSAHRLKCINMVVVRVSGKP